MSFFGRLVSLYKIHLRLQKNPESKNIKSLITMFCIQIIYMKVFPFPGNSGGLWCTTWQLCWETIHYMTLKSWCRDNDNEKDSIKHKDSL